METPRVVFLTLVLALPPAVLAQAPAEKPATGTATIRTTVQEVVLDLIVRDARGREVKNLNPSDVTKKLSARARDPGGLRFDPWQ